MNHAALFTDAKAGRLDAMGRPWSEWLVALEGQDGRALRDANLHVVYVTQAEYQARQSAPVGQLELFATAPAPPSSLSPEDPS